MDKTTLDGILPFLPDPETHSEEECFHYIKYVDKDIDKIRKARMRFKKDDSGKNWIYMDTQVEKVSG